MAGYVGEAEPCTAFQFWTPHEAHHLAYASVVGDAIVVAARVFDIYAAVVVVSRDRARYVRTAVDSLKLHFLAIELGYRQDDRHDLRRRVAQDSSGDDGTSEAAAISRSTLTNG